LALIITHSPNLCIELATSVGMYFSEMAALPVRNTFLHFEESEAPKLTRSRTEPSSRTSHLEGDWDHQAAEVETYEADAQPCIARDVTKDPFDSPCLPVEMPRDCLQSRHGLFGVSWRASEEQNGDSQAAVDACNIEKREVGLQPYVRQMETLDGCESPNSSPAGAFAFCPTLQPGSLSIVEGSWGHSSLQPSAAGAPTMDVPQSSNTADAAGHPQQAVQAHSKRASLRTTVMLRNMPNNYTRANLIDLLDSEGFIGKFDFVYLPIDFRTHAALGYAFVNLVSPEDAQHLHQRMDGFSKWLFPSSKACSVSWSNPHQGLESHIARYRNSPLMHEVVPDEYRPVLFKDGQRIPFPPPTKKIKFPRQGTERMLVGARGGC